MRRIVSREAKAVRFIGVSLSKLGYGDLGGGYKRIGPHSQWQDGGRVSLKHLSNTLSFRVIRVISWIALLGKLDYPRITRITRRKLVIRMYPGFD